MVFSVCRTLRGPAQRVIQWLGGHLEIRCAADEEVQLEF
jgi:hypothetical protein